MEVKISAAIGRGNTITVCGSMKFWEQIIDVGSALERKGNVVLTPVIDNRPKDEITDEDLKMYAEIHEKKILMSDCVYVVNIGGYVGKSVKREIRIATEAGKPVFYHEMNNIPRIVTLIGSARNKEIFDFEFKKRSAMGEVVFVPAIFSFDPSEINSQLDANLDILHERKMLMSDEIIVVNGSGHIGADTMREIEFAKAHQLHIKMMFPEWNQGVL